MVFKLSKKKHFKFESAFVVDKLFKVHYFYFQLHNFTIIMINSVSFKHKEKNV